MNKSLNSWNYIFCDCGYRNKNIGYTAKCASRGFPLPGGRFIYNKQLTFKTKTIKTLLPY